MLNQFKRWLQAWEIKEVHYDLHLQKALVPWEIQHYQFYAMPYVITRML